MCNVNQLSSIKCPRRERLVSATEIELASKMNVELALVLGLVVPPLPPETMKNERVAVLITTNVNGSLVTGCCRKSVKK